MEIIYRAFDGKEFDSVTECAAYEEKAHKLKMWFKDGKTTLTEEAFVVKLDNENDTRIFIERCDNEGSDHSGIEFDEYTADTGLFVWDMNACQYFEMDEEVLDALIHYLKDEHLV
jgi:hypothetical protein